MTDFLEVFNSGLEMGIAHEREKVVKYLQERVEDFKACTNDDSCPEHIYVLEGIIEDIEDSEHYE